MSMIEIWEKNIYRYKNRIQIDNKNDNKMNENRYWYIKMYDKFFFSIISLYAKKSLTNTEIHLNNDIIKYISQTHKNKSDNSLS